MDETAFQDILAGLRRSGAETDQRIDEARKRRAEETRAGQQREQPALTMATGAAIFAVGLVLGGLLLR